MEIDIEPLFNINLFGYEIPITEGIIIQWVIILICLILSLFLTSKLKKTPDKKQSSLEIFVDFINNLVKENMGEKYIGFVPYIGSLVIFLLIMNLVGLIGLKPPTKDFNVTLGLSLITFLVIQFYTIKKKGLSGYFIGYTKPVWVLLPINIIERIMLPISLSLRLFGNITAAVIIMDLIYEALGKIGWIFQIAIPVPLHLYLDIFDGGIQMLIFVMLTMINIKVISEH